MQLVLKYVKRRKMKGTLKIMNLKDILNKIKLHFIPKTKRLEASKDEQLRIKCEKEGRTEEYQKYLKDKENKKMDIARYEGYIKEKSGDVRRWKHDLKEAQRAMEFIRPNSDKDIQERDYWGDNFYDKFLKVVPENLDLRFHGTPIYNTKEILESGGIFSSVDINEGYMASTDLSGEISASSKESLNRTIQGWFANLAAYGRSLPCGCIFALNPRTEKDKELKQYDAMESVNFKEHPEQLYGIFTSTENIPNVRIWLEKSGFSPDLAYTFEGFLKKIEKEKSLQDNIVIKDPDIKKNLEEVSKKYSRGNTHVENVKESEKSL